MTTGGTPEQAWNGTGPYSGTGAITEDGATQVAFKIPLIAAGECQCIAYAYILNEADLEEALEATTAVGVAADGIDISDAGFTLICPGDSVALTIIDGDDYDWTWTPTDGLSTAVGDTVTASPDVTTVYTAVGVGICGTLEREITVEVPEPPIADAGPDIDVCPVSCVAGDFCVRHGGLVGRTFAM